MDATIYVPVNYENKLKFKEIQDSTTYTWWSMVGSFSLAFIFIYLHSNNLLVFQTIQYAILFGTIAAGLSSRLVGRIIREI